jgi:dihydrodipicolinate synthase/N-acetylneuraminate lyase
MIDVIYGRFGGAPAAKAVMAMTGIDCGSVRPPLAPLSSEEIRELRDVLQKVAAAPHMGC